MVIKQELKLYVLEAAYASDRLSVEIHPVFHIELLKQIFLYTTMLHHHGIKNDINKTFPNPTTF